jgi:hypothetical protein
MHSKCIASIIRNGVQTVVQVQEDSIVVHIGTLLAPTILLPRPPRPSSAMSALRLLRPPPSSNVGDAVGVHAKIVQERSAGTATPSLRVGWDSHSGGVDVGADPVASKTVATPTPPVESLTTRSASLEVSVDAKTGAEKRSATLTSSGMTTLSVAPAVDTGGVGASAKPGTKINSEAPTPPRQLCGHVHFCISVDVAAESERRIGFATPTLAATFFASFSFLDRLLDRPVLIAEWHLPHILVLYLASVTIPTTIAITCTSCTIATKMWLMASGAGTRTPDDSDKDDADRAGCHQGDNRGSRGAAARRVAPCKTELRRAAPCARTQASGVPLRLPGPAPQGAHVLRCRRNARIIIAGRRGVRPWPARRGPVSIP